MSNQRKRKRRKSKNFSRIGTLISSLLLLFCISVSAWALYRLSDLDHHFRDHLHPSSTVSTDTKQASDTQTPQSAVSPRPAFHLNAALIAYFKQQAVTWQGKLTALIEEHQPQNGTLYLTFDDGPGPYTEELLGILEKHKVKVTFFITGNYGDYYDMIGKAYKAGHSIGVHTFTHDYKQIYASTDAFWADIDRAAELVKQQTGEYTKLLRFAGGSSNTISANYSPGIMSVLVEQVRQRGYQFFDWNISSGDGGSITSSDSVYNNVTTEAPKYHDSVVLFHDTKKTTVDAIDRLLTWGKKNGYAFKALTVDSPPMHHGVNN